MHAIASKAAAFGEALTPEFRHYSQAVVDNAKTLAQAMVDEGFDIVTGGTDNHLMLVDLRPKKLTGDVAEKSLDRAGITCNKNGIPFDPEKPTVTSGIRLGMPAATTRGFGGAERSEEHTSELQSLMRISYAVFCLKKKKNKHKNSDERTIT